MKQNSSIFIFLFFASQLFAQIPAVTSTTHWQVYDGNSTWVPSALDFKNYCLSGLAGLAPTGGTDGQVLTKQSSTNYDYAWETPSGGGGGVATVTGSSVDNTDAANPVVNALPLTITSTKIVDLDDGNGIEFVVSPDFESNNGWSGAGFVGTGIANTNSAGFYYDEDNTSYAFEVQINNGASTRSSTLRMNDGGVEFASNASGGGYSFNGETISFASGALNVFTGAIKQVEIGDNAVFVPPHYTSSAKEALTPSDGWMVYDTDLDGTCIYDGTKWLRISQKATPSVAVGAGAGSGASATVTGNDIEGIVTLTTGTTPTTSAVLFTVTWNDSYSTAPIAVMMTGNSNNAANLPGGRIPYVSSVGTTTFVASNPSINGLADATVYVFNYRTIQ